MQRTPSASLLMLQNWEKWVGDISEAYAAIHMDLSRLKKWSDKSFMKFNKGKSNVVHPEKRPHALV